MRARVEDRKNGKHGKAVRNPEPFCSRSMQTLVATQNRQAALVVGLAIATCSRMHNIQPRFPILPLPLCRDCGGCFCCCCRSHAFVFLGLFFLALEACPAHALEPSSQTASFSSTPAALALRRAPFGYATRPLPLLTPSALA